jgi:hypothetical protein
MQVPKSAAQLGDDPGDRSDRSDRSDRWDRHIDLEVVIEVRDAETCVIRCALPREHHNDERTLMPVTQVLAVIPVSDFDAGRSWWERLLGAPGEQPMPGEDVLEWHLTDTGGIQLVRDVERSGTAQLTLVVDDLQAEARALADRGITLGAVSTTLDISTALVCDEHGNHVVVAQPIQPAS